MVQSPRIQRKLWLHKQSKPEVRPLRVTRDTNEMIRSPSLPVYKNSVVTNKLLTEAHSLYRACGLSACLTHQGHCYDPHGGFIGREFTAEYGPLPTKVHAKPAFLDCSGLSWYSMQICDPPIMVARLYTSCGGLNEWNWPDFSYAAEDAHVYTTIYDRDGITMGLVYDTAAAILRPFAGLDGQDPDQGWEFLLHYGIDKGDHDGVPQRVYGSDEPDDDAEDHDGEDHFGSGSLEHGALRYDSQKRWDHNGLGP